MKYSRKINGKITDNDKELYTLLRDDGDMFDVFDQNTLN